MKKTYQVPEIEVIRFEVEDVITASSNFDGMTDGGEGGAEGGGITSW